MEDVQKRLNEKTIVLKTELPKVIGSFQQIQETLKVKALAYKNSNFEQATNLTTIGSQVFGLVRSAQLILSNVSSEEGVNKSLAIISSGALTGHTDALIKLLENSEATHNISLDLLKESNAKIQEITQDVDIKQYTLSEDKE